MRRARGASQGEGYWMIVFAVALLVTVGFFNMIDGIAAIANSHVFIANAHYVVGDLRVWGWVVLILGTLQIIAAVAVLAGSQAARWFAVVVISLNAIGQMFFIPAYPFWSLLIIAVDVVALWGLCAYGSRENLEAAA
jgi:predicted membrane metal-binding protein